MAIQQKELKISLQIWLRALTHPSLSSYEMLASDPDLSVKRACLWILLGTLVTSVLSFLGSLRISPYLIETFPGVQEWFVAQLSIFAIALTGGLVVLVTQVITVIAWIALIHLTALVLGGKGSFSNVFSFAAAFIAPLMLMNGLTMVVPYLSFFSHSGSNHLWNYPQYHNHQSHPSFWLG
jgi:hypothetical protein